MEKIVSQDFDRACFNSLFNYTLLALHNQLYIFIIFAESPYDSLKRTDMHLPSQITPKFSAWLFKKCLLKISGDL